MIKKIEFTIPILYNARRLLRLFAFIAKMSFIAEESSVSIVKKIDDLATEMKELFGEINVEFLVRTIIDNEMITLEDIKSSAQFNIEEHLTIQKYQSAILEALDMKIGTIPIEKKNMIRNHEIITSILKFNPKAFHNMNENNVIELVTKRFNKLPFEGKLSFVQIFESNLLVQVLSNFINEKYKPKKVQSKMSWADRVQEDEDRIHNLPEIQFSPKSAVEDHSSDSEMSAKQSEEFQNIVDYVRSMERNFEFKRKDKFYDKNAPHLLTSWSKLLSKVCEGSRFLLSSQKDSYSHENYEVWHLTEGKSDSIVKRVIAPVHMRYVHGLFGFWYTIDSHKSCHIHHFDENWDWCHISITSKGIVKDITNDRLLELCAGSRK